jgi:hypothetical protein
LLSPSAHGREFRYSGIRPHGHDKGNSSRGAVLNVLRGSEPTAKSVEGDFSAEIEAVLTYIEAEVQGLPISKV